MLFWHEKLLVDIYESRGVAPDMDQCGALLNDFSTLPWQEQKALKGTYEGETLAEIAISLGFATTTPKRGIVDKKSRERVRLFVKMALKRLAAKHFFD